MDIIKNITDLASANSETVEAGIEQVANLVDEKTGGAFSGQIDAAEEFMKGQLGIDKTAEETAPEAE